MTSFFRFPHTPHLAWLGTGQPRKDKVLIAEEVDALLAADVVVEEKVDGANVGFSTTEDGVLLVQNRGSYLLPGACPPQFRPLWPWLKLRREALVDALQPDLILFGEWALAVHSVHYSALPDWFLGFDVFDRTAARFWGTGRRNNLIEQLGLQHVPRLDNSRHNRRSLEELLTISRLGSAAPEGIVIRKEQQGWTIGRAKLVRAEFTQAMETHWSRGPFRRNALEVGTTRWM